MGLVVDTSINSGRPYKRAGASSHTQDNARPEPLGSGLDPLGNGERPIRNAEAGTHHAFTGQRCSEEL
jgi:hypothetical protein